MSVEGYMGIVGNEASYQFVKRGLVNGLISTMSKPYKPEERLLHVDEYDQICQELIDSFWQEGHGPIKRLKY